MQQKIVIDQRLCMKQCALQCKAADRELYGYLMENGSILVGQWAVAENSARINAIVEACPRGAIEFR